jgi:hypothetical protein
LQYRCRKNNFIRRVVIRRLVCDMFHFVLSTGFFKSAKSSSKRHFAVFFVFSK